MEPSSPEFQIALAEQLASLARRMTVLHAAGHAAGLLHTPPPAVPDRVSEHVKYYTGILRRHPAMGPRVAEVLDRYKETGRDLARLETEAEDVEVVLARLQGHQRYLTDLPKALAGCPPLQQLFAPKAAPAPPPPAARSLTGRLMPLPNRAPTRPFFPENQALLDKGLAQLRALDARMLLIRSACTMAASPAAPPSLTLPPQAREAARKLATLVAEDPAALATLTRLAEHHAATKKLFDQRPLQQPEAARAALDQLGAMAAALAELPAVAQLLEGR